MSERDLLAASVGAWTVILLVAGGIVIHRWWRDR